MSHLIPLSQAVEMTKKFRQNIDSIMDPKYAGQYLVPKCETFTSAAVQSVLNQTGCAKVRIYYGMSDNLDIHAILVGVDADDKDMVEPGAALADPIIIEEAIRCPTICPPDSPLNTD